MFKKILKFSVIGSINLVIDILALNFLLWMWPTSEGWKVLFYNAVAVFIASINSFFCNKFWTFQEHGKITTKQVSRFTIVTGGNMILNTGVLSMVMKVLPVTGAGIDSLLVKVLVAILCMAFSFVALAVCVFVVGKERMDKMIPGRPRTIKHELTLSLVVVVRDQEKDVQKFLSSCIWSLIRMVDDFEIIVVNDGSKDRTERIVSTIAASDGRVKLFSHQENQGYGGALSTGFAKATKQYTMYMDSDGQFDIRDLNSMLPLLDTYDGVFGYRIDRQDSLLRKLNSWGWKKITAFVFGLAIKDIDCAFKIFKTEYFKNVTIEARGALLSAEVVYKFIRAGYTYTEVGVKHLPRTAGKSTGANPAVIVNAFRELTYFVGLWHEREQAK